MKTLLVLLPLALLLAACDSTSSMSSRAMTPALDGAVLYEVTLTPTWTADTHPVDYPAAGVFTGPHFSGLIGASHAEGYRLFAEGALPTPGLERLSEEGKHSPLDAEIGAAIAEGQAGAIFETDAIKDLSKTATATVAVSERFPMASAVAMIAPSPDWFAGAANVALRQDGRWVSEKEVVLIAYDAGGDRGASYTAPDADTDPKQPTRKNEAPPFLEDGAGLPVGKLTFRRMQGAP